MQLLTFIASFCLLAGSLGLQERVEQEINLVKEEAVAIRKLSSSMILKLDRLTTHQKDYRKSDDKQPVLPSSSATYPRSCIEYYKMGDMRTGWKTIDPYQNQQRFSVRCNYDGSDIVTEFGLEAMWTETYSGPLTCFDQPDLRVPGYEDICAGARNSIAYELTDNQMAAALLVSGRCSQKIVWSCHSNSLLYLQEYAGNTTLYGRALHSETRTLRQGFCDCDSQRTCHMCQCGTEKQLGWLTDDITIADNSRLPIKTVMLGDLANRRELAQITVMPVQCTAPMY